MVALIALYQRTEAIKEREVREGKRTASVIETLVVWCITLLKQLGEMVGHLVRPYMLGNPETGN
jgi:hypothetical protein